MKESEGLLFLELKRLKLFIELDFNMLIGYLKELRLFYALINQILKTQIEFKILLILICLKKG